MNPMTRSVVTSLLVVALVAAGAVTSARAEEPKPAAPRSVDLGAAIDRAAARMAAEPVRRDSRPTPSASRNEMMQGGGGGGHVGMIISIVGAVAGAGATYYMVKQMQKTTNQITQVNKPQ